MEEKERYIYTKIDGYYWIKDIETNENYCVDKKIVKLLNQQDKEIADLQHRLDVAEKALELAVDIANIKSNHFWTSEELKEKAESELKGKNNVG